MTDELFLRAMAKINLGLDVIGKRDDGYHEVRMVMQTIKLFDKIELFKTREQEFSMTANFPFIPVDDGNLMMRAAKLMFTEYGLPGGMRMTLQKHIPIAAGLAGGSTDAASVIYGINRMYDLGLSMKEMMEQGRKLGADIPFCLLRGTALSEGIGEKLTKLPDCPPFYAVLLKPPVSVSTKTVYDLFDSQRDVDHPNIDALIDRIGAGDLEGMGRYFKNVLEPITAKEYPVIGQMEEFLMENGAKASIMSGSGPTVFGVFTDLEEAKLAAVKARNTFRKPEVHIVNVNC